MASIRLPCGGYCAVSSVVSVGVCAETPAPHMTPPRARPHAQYIHEYIGAVGDEISTSVVTLDILNMILKYLVVLAHPQETHCTCLCSLTMLCALYLWVVKLEVSVSSVYKLLHREINMHMCVHASWSNIEKKEKCWAERSTVL
jgi:hypothetical protein